jgi:hypothetical protein
MRNRVPALESGAIESLEQRVTRALESAHAPAPEVLGYGEISSVLALRFDGGGVACKRLPPFPSARAFEAYRSCFEDQIEAFEAGGVPVLATELRRVAGAGSGPIAYCVQPLVDAPALVPARLAHDSGPRGTELVQTILDLALAYVAPTRGFDGQLANWAVADGELVYLDVSTPLLRDEEGRERLDVGVFLASLPWALRGFVRHFMLRGILDPYYSPRGVVLDLLGNLIKEGLGERLPEWVPIAARRLGEPLSVDEVRRHYTGDARTWRLLQRLRRLDRAWQRHVRRRPYPFLLPGPVQRHV